ncbi:hypothetical protein Tco_1523525 [Tanacetum coccineum]
MGGGAWGGGLVVFIRAVGERRGRWSWVEGRAVVVEEWGVGWWWLVLGVWGVVVGLCRWGMVWVGWKGLLVWGFGVYWGAGVGVVGLCGVGGCGVCDVGGCEHWEGLVLGVGAVWGAWWKMLGWVWVPGGRVRWGGWGCWGVGIGGKSGGGVVVWVGRSGVGGERLWGGFALVGCGLGGSGWSVYGVDGVLVRVVLGGVVVRWAVVGVVGLPVVSGWFGDRGVERLVVLVG